MFKIMVPILLSVIGLAMGALAGNHFRPDDSAATDQAHGSDVGTVGEHIADTAPNHGALPEYFKMSNQFIVPLVSGDRINSLVILSLSLEIDTGTSEQVFAREPKLRDVFLRLLFDHANGGGFRNDLTDARTLVVLREGLLEEAHKVLGSIVSEVLITDIVRQDN